MENISLLFAFAAGALSFFSPCVFPLLPAYVAQLTGASFQDGKALVDRRVLMARSVSFILGFSLIFTMLGASASALGRLLSEHYDLLLKASGLLIIVFGMQMARLLNLRLFMKEKRPRLNAFRQKNNAASFMLGIAFGAGWTPCVGLALSSILLLAGSTESLYSGIVLLMVYSFGLGAPFLVMSWIVSRSLGVMRRANRWLPRLSLFNGWMLIGLGLLLFTGHMQKLSAWLTSFVPFVL